MILLETMDLRSDLPATAAGLSDVVGKPKVVKIGVGVLPSGEEVTFYFRSYQTREDARDTRRYKITSSHEDEIGQGEDGEVRVRGYHDWPKEWEVVLRRLLQTTDATRPTWR